MQIGVPEVVVTVLVLLVVLAVVVALLQSEGETGELLELALELVD